MERKRKASTVREADGSVHRAIKQAKTEKEQTKRHILAKELYKQKRKNPAAFEPISAKYGYADAEGAPTDKPKRKPRANESAEKAAPDAAGEPAEAADKRQPRGQRPKQDGTPLRMGALVGVRKKPPSLLERKKQEADTTLEEQRAQREKDRAAQADKRERMLQQEKVRKEQKKKMFKQNARGQPLMKHRMESILEKLTG